ncbi:YhgE/Pip domain-containing protein [Clostridium felsineum]|uniref:YhgE/Pip domain-containing protein n=1 Tax=Clostridium felsineum TaxID=36839 RepID=UPI00214DC05F|nr:YhgE/Pip domain-containing protein [Clostridium felsineum]MCR3760331.1 YhgE/Pip domain-containing protein [Clostridium felsineum]
MKKIFRVFLRDLKSIRKSPSAIIMVLGLCFLPSLYAWINIKACWDPYANTGNIPVAVVNEDQGAIFNNKKINAGNEIVAELKKNKSIDWTFVDEWQGNYGLNEGKYYALLDIPSNFSSGLVSLTTPTPEKPAIVYRGNEKLNAIASKITNTAKDHLAEELKVNFVNTVTKEALKLIKSNSNTLNKSNIVALKETLNEATKNLGDTQNQIQNANKSAENISAYLSRLQTNLPKITDQITKLQNAAESSKDLISQTKQTLTTSSNNLNNDMIDVQAKNGQFQALLSQLKNSDGSTSDLDNIVNQLININSSMNSILKSDLDYLQSIIKTNPNPNINSLINSFQGLDSSVNNASTSLNQLKTSVDSGAPKDTINGEIDALSNLTNQLSLSMLNSSNSLYSTVLPVLNNIGDNLNNNLTDISGVLESTKVVVPELNALANYGIASSQLSVNQANELNNKLSSLSLDLNNINNKMNSLSDDDINSLTKLLSMNTDELASFISSPLITKEVDVYGQGVFGVGLTPFYSVLAIWVGVLLLSSLLTTEFKNSTQKDHLNIWQKHFGKMLLFLILSLIQSTIIVLGDVYLLGVNPQNMLMLLIFGWICSVTFTFIIFTLVAIFGNVGKAIAVVIMVFQIAGAGGIYPIQTNPKIFGMLEPLWPFTYGINGFREAISGPIWSTVYKNILALGCFVVFFFCMTVLKKPFHKLTKTMEHKFKESGL